MGPYESNFRLCKESVPTGTSFFQALYFLFPEPCLSDSGDWDLWPISVGTRAVIALLFSCFEMCLLLVRERQHLGNWTSEGNWTTKRSQLTSPLWHQRSSPQNCSVMAPEIKNEALEKIISPLRKCLYVGRSCFHMVPLQYKNVKSAGWLKNAYLSMLPGWPSTFRINSFNPSRLVRIKSAQQNKGRLTSETGNAKPLY